MEMMSEHFWIITLIKQSDTDITEWTEIGLDGGVLLTMWTFLFLLQDMVVIVDHFDKWNCIPVTSILFSLLC